jgi:hypothetical protein
MLPDSSCRPPLYPPVTPLCENQEQPRILLSPFKMGDAHPSLFPEMEAELHSQSVVSPPRHRLPSLLRPIKGTGRLKICHHIHSLPYFRFLLHKNSLLSYLKSPPPSLLTGRPHLLLCRPELWLMRSLESPSSSPSIHDELSCITAAAHSNSGEFLLSHVHCEPKVNHSL